MTADFFSLFRDLLIARYDLSGVSDRVLDPSEKCKRLEGVQEDGGAAL